MTWSNIIQHVDKHKLPWAKRSTEHVTTKIKKKDLSFYNYNKMLNKK